MHSRGLRHWGYDGCRDLAGLIRTIEHRHTVCIGRTLAKCIEIRTANMDVATAMTVTNAILLAVIGLAVLLYIGFYIFINPLLDHA